MKWALALLLCCAALAGCTAGQDDPAPPNADPYPSESYPPSETSSTPPPTGTSTVSPVNSSSSSSSASVAPGPARFGPHDQEESDTDPYASGLFVGGRLGGSGGLVRVEAAANNVGERSYRVRDGCGSPWSESMAGPSGAVQIRQPAATCPAVSYRDFPAHDSFSRAFEWNGTLWDAASGSFVPAPAGTYTWTIAFDVHGGSGDPPPEHATLTLQFEATLG